MSIELGLQLRANPGAGGEALRQTARAAEGAGYAALTVADHLADDQLGPLTACAALIEATERVRVGPLVLNNDFRNPVVLAREVAALAELSAGRFELGIGAGHIAAEYPRAGLRFDGPARRIDRLGESVGILRALLRGERVTCSGVHYNVDGEQLSPTPRRDIPIVIGGNSPRLLALAAREADIVGLTGFSQRRGGADPPNLATFGTTAAAAQVARVTRLAADHGRRPRFQALVQWAEVTSNRNRAAHRVAAGVGVPTAVVLDSPYILLGTTREIAAQLRGHHEHLGIDRWTLFADHPGGQPDCVASFASLAETLVAA